MLNDLTCKSLSPSGLARQVSDMYYIKETSDNFKGKSIISDVNIVTTKQHMFTTQHASHDFIAKTSADDSFEEVWEANIAS